ncbi:cytochrome C oxidase subunit IV family protein [Noviherbaspirillum sp.]|uniref:cytochrome C oxidase subunit IV family protein n=1 Tax=Noviherbaspirillum sp. TaxID=1926288 RepID=UPI002D5D632A|nr:cytochrome C oxidase subunit IV family protein [Noviherbaspirillum sp.]HZW20368.1 cytochrome C oxidase subunit IV family protein [Noviherbaspirillum sp.]
MMTSAAKNHSVVHAWAGLLALTGLSLVAGHSHGHAQWMPLLVAALIWIKGTVVARYFLESKDAHPFIVWLLRLFIAFAPVALLITDGLCLYRC